MDLIKLKALLTDHMDHPFYMAAYDKYVRLQLANIPAFGMVYCLRGHIYITLQTKFVNSRSQSAVLHVAKHELYHWLLGHLNGSRWLPALLENQQVANIAMDLAIHEVITPPSEIIKDSTTVNNMNIKHPDLKLEHNKTTEYYYSQLIAADVIPPSPNVGIGNVLKGEFPEGAENIDVIIGDPLTDEELQNMIDDVGRIAGDTPGELKRAIQAENGLNLASFMNALVNMSDETGGRGKRKTWSRPNRRNPTFRGVIKTAKKRIGLVLDTSGSIGNSELNQMAGALVKFSQWAKVFVMPTDTEVRDPFWFKGKLDSVKGGGGTEFTSAFNMAEEMRFDCLAILTDGYCGYPEKTNIKNILWGIIDNDNFDAMYGKVMKLK